MSRKQPLVSIITPCFNGAHCLYRLLDSILNQSYRPIEFILVNDGSTDDTQSIAISYKSKFKEAGIDYTIIQQENKGLGGAINAGLKCFKGDYICWPDADDYLEPSSIEERVRILETNQEYAVVSSDAYIRDSSQLNIKGRVSSKIKCLNDPNQFVHHLNGDSIFCSGCHMARSSMFLSVHPKRQIFPARRGQNWQLLLPMYYKYPWIYLDKPLYNYVSYPNSMSKDKNTINDILLRYREHEEILKETLKEIEMEQNADMHVFFSFVEDKYAKLRMNEALKSGDTELFLQEYVKKQQTTGIDLHDRLSFWRSKRPLFNVTVMVGAKIIHKAPQPDPEKAVNKLIGFEEKISCGEYKDSKVSILIPCYNAAEYLETCFNCILNQSHHNIQVLIMDDGSTDNSTKIIQKAADVFQKAGIEFIYFHQQNRGAAAAVNELIPHADGKYILLYDTDDLLYQESVFEQVHFLETHMDYMMVRTNGYVVNDLAKPGKELFVNEEKIITKTNIFDDLAQGKTYNWPGSYMIRRDEFIKRTGGQIYISRFGQNLQFMLPMAYESLVGFVNKPLMSYYEHSSSHSHSGGDDWVLARTHGYCNNRISIIESINLPIEEKKRLVKQIRANEEKAVNRLAREKNASIAFKVSCFLYKVINKCKRTVLNAKQEKRFRKQNEMGYWSIYQ